ncbi:11487_t:CDS:2, partial [Gigaspora margarita]
LLKQFYDDAIELLFPTIAHAQIILLALRSNLESVKDNEVQKYWLFAENNEFIKLLDWWNTYAIEYPILSELAYNYLYIQA